MVILTSFVVRNRDYRGGHRGSAHIEFHDVEDAAAVYDSAQREPFFLVNRTLSLDYAEERKPLPSPSHVLYFRNFRGDVNDLREVLSGYMRHVYQISFRMCCLLLSRR